MNIHPAEYSGREAATSLLQQRTCHAGKSDPTARRGNRIALAAAGLTMGTLALAGRSAGNTNTGTLPEPSSISSAPGSGSGNSGTQTPGNGGANTDTGDKIPQVGDTKEVDGHKYVYVDNDLYGAHLRFAVPVEQQESEKNSTTWYVGDKSRPIISIKPDSKIAGTSPAAVAEYVVGADCTADTDVVIPGALNAAISTCFDGWGNNPDSTGYINYIVQTSDGGPMVDVLVDRYAAQGGGTAAWVDTQEAAAALDIHVIK